MKKLLGLASVAALALVVLAPSGALAAQTIGQIAGSLKTQTTAVSTLVTVVAFVLGVGMAITGLLKFKAHSQNPNDPSAKMSTAFMLVFVGAALVAIPAALGSGIATIFGSDADTTDATTGFKSVD